MLHAAPTFALLSPSPVRAGTWFLQTRYLFTPLPDYFVNFFHELHGFRMAFEPERYLGHAPCVFYEAAGTKDHRAFDYRKSLKFHSPWNHGAMSSRTSVQLDKDTKELLDRVRREKNAKTYAEAIRLLAKEAMKLELSEIGTLPKLRSFRRDKHVS